MAGRPSKRSVTTGVDRDAHRHERLRPVELADDPARRDGDGVRVGVAVGLIAVAVVLPAVGKQPLKSRTPLFLTVMLALSLTTSGTVLALNAIVVFVVPSPTFN